MALKYTIDSLDDVPADVRPHYAAGENGKFILGVENHPDAAKNLALTVKVDEFRNNNTSLLKKLNGTDPSALQAKIVELEKQVTSGAAPARIAELEATLVTVQQKADRSVLREALRGKLLAAGALPAAVDIALDKAEPVFEVKGDAVQARPNTFSKTRPGELLTPDEWIANATGEFPFLFGPSSGGGAPPRNSGGGMGDGKKTLRNPTPQELGQYSKEIARGEVRIEYTT